MDLKALIKDIPDFPQPGIVYRDITTLLQDPEGLQYTVTQLTEQAAKLAPDYIVGIESRGFIFGMPVAHQLRRGFVPIRKRGKLPRAVYGVDYDLEYGQDRLEVHQDAFTAGSRVLIVDDLLATGGTAAAAAQLIEKAGATVAGFSFVIELEGLAGRDRLPPQSQIISLIQY
ncbi:adenine phosphoribosyltransferase [Leptolyngbya sp. BC1307]|uniref:adenine phosphoribosyltransferase n=1 Tax=Leptolyngbya sp. BC1307 TaxID=2029589 RepID=UPI000EFD20EC|nr:adenine phosphoribosyltransferase [Leptolyngbya sp. BC1307]